MGDYNQDIQARTKQQNRSNVQQLKMIGSSHPTGLTSNLLKLFEARPPLEFKPPPEKRKCPPYTGMSQFVSNFAEKGDPEYQPPVVKGETPAQKKIRIQKLKLEEGARKAAEELEKYDPHHNPDATGDPYKTLFVSSLNYETSESKIKREFEAYGPIKRAFTNVAALVDILVRLVSDKSTNKPRGYAFIEYLHTRDMKAAYKQGDGRKIDGRRVLVDVERGRTVPNWRPRRLGGGLGTSRIAVEDTTKKLSEREFGGPSKSVEPKTRDDRSVDREREKSRERGKEREKEQEKSRERSHDRPKERDQGDHKDRDRTRDRDRDRERDSRRDRHGRDRDRDRPRERDKKREREYEVGEIDHERGRSRGKSYDLADSKRDRDRCRDRDDGHEYNEHVQGREQYGVTYSDQDRYSHDKYDPMEYNDHYNRATSEHLEKEGIQDMVYEY